MTTPTFGEKLRQLRRAAKLTLMDLAEAKDCSVVYISMVERGEKQPPAPDVVEALVRRCGRPDLVDEMILLACRSRKAVEISLQNRAPEEAEMIASLARRTSEGPIPPDVVAQLLAILKRGKPE